MGTHELSVQFNCRLYVFVISIWVGTLARPYRANLTDDWSSQWLYV